MPRATVIQVTNRIGGLDVLFESLRRQSCTDFELVLVDSLWKHRAEMVAERAEACAFPVKHIEPRPNGFPRAEQSLAFNCGIVVADSPLIIYECDYTWLGADTVATHVDFQERHPGCAWMGDFYYVDLPRTLCPTYCVELPQGMAEMDFMEQNNETAARLAADLEAGLLDDYLWSIFDVQPAPPFTINYRHEKKGQEEYDGDWNYFSFKNESVPLEALLDVNGHDEEYDGAHSKNDAELAYRLREFGVQLWSGPRGAGAVHCLNPRTVLNCRAMDRPRTTNDVLCWHTKQASRRIPVNPGVNLRSLRSGKP